MDAPKIYLGDKMFGGIVDIWTGEQKRNSVPDASSVGWVANLRLSVPSSADFREDQVRELRLPPSIGDFDSRR